MALSSKNPMDQIVGILQGISGLSYVQRGAPESYNYRLSAFVTLGGQRVVDKAGGLCQREAKYFIGFAYRVQQQEGGAEDALAAALDAFILAFYDDRTLGGTVLANTMLDMGGADEPQYQPVSGQEVRIYPVVVVTTQQFNP